MNDQTTIDTTDATVIDTEGGEQTPRDYESEARAHGWTPKEEFRGDPNKWVDSETFAKRADEVMPFLKKQNAALKREMDDLKKTVKQASSHFEKVEERAYNRALADLEARHTEAVETGDTAGAKAAVKEMRALERDMPKPDAAPVVDEAKAKQELGEWIEKTGWYGSDDQKTRYADLQADLMGPALEYPGGQAKWLEDLGAKVERKFTDPKPSATNGGGNRSAPSGGGKTYNDLPQAAKAACDKWIKQGLIKDRAAYVASYDFS